MPAIVSVMPSASSPSRRVCSASPRSWTAALLLLLAASLMSSCSPTLDSFTGPTDVAPGQEFEVVLTADAPPGVGFRGAAVVLQCPLGVTPLGHDGIREASGNLSGVNASLNGTLPATILPAEPGMRRIAYTLSLTQVDRIYYRAWFRAPTTQGPLNIKVALLRETAGPNLGPGVWEVFDPLGVTAFSQVGGNHELNINVGPGGLGTEPRWSRRGFSGALAGVGLTYPFQGVAAHDVNGDGRAEFRRGVSAAIDPVTGLLTAASQATATPLGGQHAVGDINGDGFVDVGGFGAVSLGDANGTMTAIAGPAPGGLGMAMGDINGDGFDDVVSTAAGLAVHLWDPLSQTLVPSGLGLPQAGGGRFLLLQDLNDDGFLDILWTRFGGPSVWLGDGGTSWAEVPAFGLGVRDFWAAQAADFDGDGRTDLVLSGYENGAGSGLRFFRAVVGPNGARTWVEDTLAGLPGNDPYLDLQLADFDGDGWIDIITGKGISGLQPGRIEIWRNLVGLGFAAAPTTWTSGLPQTAMSGATGIALADANGDGLLDLGFSTLVYGLRVYVQEPGGWALPSMAGTVLGTAPGAAPVDILEVNGSSGGLNRSVNIGLGAPIRIDLKQPPSNPAPADHFLFGTFGVPNAATVLATPWGDFAFAPQPLAPQLPGLFTLASSAAPTTGLLPMGPTPSTVFVAAGPGFPVTLTLQGLIAQTSAASNAAAITNGVILRIR